MEFFLSFVIIVCSFSTVALSLFLYMTLRPFKVRVNGFMRGIAVMLCSIIMYGITSCFYAFNFSFDGSNSVFAPVIVRALFWLGLSSGLLMMVGGIRKQTIERESHGK